ncbi:IPTL-CTERM sorting domain-containing protein [Diaphorobacter caeni]|uniref:IPTL-CTERM sorting domain-containing protein n=1 Tax=Diaphorobacter caeni TaxID=2784387 RepID=UPI00188F7126|nr:IPTL-CTERM sorting domain-containing protein [Diaphorobacter caeni]MBF5002635.1 IPTL-CTERM sorting domain-containing protein [Diaphorobacter caeni]
MHRTLKDILYTAVAGVLVLTAAPAGARELPNVDALAASPSPVSTKDLRQVERPPVSVKRATYDERLGLANFVWLDPARTPLTPMLKRVRAAGDAVPAAREEIKALAGLYGLTPAEADAAPVLQQQTLANGGRLVRFGNQRDGIPVFREHATVLLDAQSQALNVGGFVGGTRVAAAPKTARADGVAASLTPAMAVQVALGDFDFPADTATRLVERAAGGGDASDEYRWLSLPADQRGAQGGVLEQPARYRAVWFRMPQGLVPAYYLELRVLEAGVHHAFAYVIAREGGQMLFRNNLTSHDAAVTGTPDAASPSVNVVPPSFTYGVWADPLTGVPLPGPQGLDLNPYPGAGPDGHSARLVGPSRVSLASAPSFSRGDPWMEEPRADGLAFTSGNNVRAYADVKSQEGYSGMPLDSMTSCVAGAQAVSADFYGCTSNLTFDFGYDFAADPLKHQGQAASSVTNLFYVINWLHDWFYDAGFDEAAGNAQARNFGRGGLEGDPIDARALVYTVRNNASMETPADGASPIMRMHVFDIGGVPRSAALDNTIVAHEWGHYLSRRLIGNANGLTTRLGAGLGEGWGDFVAQLLTVTDADRHKPGNAQFEGAYAQGAYANANSVHPAIDHRNAAYFGSRRYPYSTDMAKNPLTFKHIQDGEPLPADVPVNQSVIDGQARAGYGNAEIHNVGEVWANMLWECYATLLNRHAFADAQRRMKSYLITGLKLTPVNPTFTEARDALLAGMAANDPQDYASCLGAFAKRGAGLEAAAPDRNAVDLRGVTESYRSGPLLVVEGMQLSMSDPEALRCDADDLLDNGETAVLSFQLRNLGDSGIGDVSVALSSDDPHVSFPGGNPVATPEVIAPGQSRALRVPVHLSGMPTHAYARIHIQPAAPDAMVQLRGQAMSVWLNADIETLNSTVDAVDVWPGGMDLAGSPWTVAGDGGEHWYQLAVPNARAISAMYTPELKVGAAEDLVLTFDQEYDFGDDATNGGQLLLSRPHSLDSALGAGQVAYTGVIWWMRDGVPNTNLLRNQAAFTGRSNGWKRHVTVNLGREFAGQTLRLGWRAGSAEKAQRDVSQYWRIDNIRIAGLASPPFASIRTQAQTCSIPAASDDTQPLPAPGQVTDQSTVAEPADASIPQTARTNAGAGAGAGAGLHPQIPALVEAAVADSDSGVPALRARTRVDQNDLHLLNAVIDDGRPATADADMDAGADVAPLRSVVRAQADAQLTAVPTLSQWGLVALTLAMAAAGLLRTRKSTTDRRH